MIKAYFEPHPGHDGKVSTSSGDKTPIDPTTTETPESGLTLAKKPLTVKEGRDLPKDGEEIKDKIIDQKKLAKERAESFHKKIIELTSSDVFTSTSDSVREILNMYLEEMRAMINYKESILLVDAGRKLNGDIDKCLESIRKSLDAQQKKPQTPQIFSRTLSQGYLMTIDPIITNFSEMRKNLMHVPSWGDEILESE